MNTRNLSVRFSTDGFAQAIRNLRTTGQAFDEALENARRSLTESLAAQREAIRRGITPEIEQAERNRARAAQQANRVIQNSYRELGIRSSEDIEQLKRQAVSAFEAIRQSGVASASDIARAQARLIQRLQELDSQLEQVEDSAEEVTDGFTVLKRVLSSLISNAVTGAIATISSSFQQLSSNVYQAGVTTENLKAQLKTLEGSAEGAEKAYAQIAEFAKTTPFELQEVTTAYISLANRGIKPTNEQLRKIGDLASSQGKSLQQYIEALLDAITGENERLKEFGIKASKSGDKVSLTFKGITKTVQQTEEAILEALLSFSELEGVMGGMAERAKTTEGKLSNISDALFQINSRIWEKIKPGSDAVLETVAAILDPLLEQETLFSSIGVQAKKFAQILQSNRETIDEIVQQGINHLEQGLKISSSQAEKLLNYFLETPTAVDDIVTEIGNLINALKIVFGLASKIGETLQLSVKGWEKLFVHLSSGGATGHGFREVAKQYGVSGQEFDQRAKKLFLEKKQQANPIFQVVNPLTLEDAYELALAEAMEEFYKKRREQLSGAPKKELLEERKKLALANANLQFLESTHQIKRDNLETPQHIDALLKEQELAYQNQVKAIKLEYEGLELQERRVKLEEQLNVAKESGTLEEQERLAIAESELQLLERKNQIQQEIGVKYAPLADKLIAAERKQLNLRNETIRLDFESTQLPIDLLRVEQQLSKTKNSEERERLEIEKSVLLLKEREIELQKESIAREAAALEIAIESTDVLEKEGLGLQKRRVELEKKINAAQKKGTLEEKKRLALASANLQLLESIHQIKLDNLETSQDIDALVKEQELVYQNQVKAIELEYEGLELQRRRVELEEQLNVAKESGTLEEQERLAIAESELQFLERKNQIQREIGGDDAALADKLIAAEKKQLDLRNEKIRLDFQSTRITIKLLRLEKQLLEAGKEKNSKELLRLEIAKSALTLKEREIQLQKASTNSEIAALKIAIERAKEEERIRKLRRRIAAEEAAENLAADRRRIALDVGAIAGEGNLEQKRLNARREEDLRFQQERERILRDNEPEDEVAREELAIQEQIHQNNIAEIEHSFRVKKLQNERLRLEHEIAKATSTGNLAAQERLALAESELQLRERTEQLSYDYRNDGEALKERLAIEKQLNKTRLKEIRQRFQSQRLEQERLALQHDSARLEREAAIIAKTRTLEQQEAIALLQEQNRLKRELLEIRQNFPPEQHSALIELAQQQSTINEKEIGDQFKAQALQQQLDAVTADLQTPLTVRARYNLEINKADLEHQLAALKLEMEQASSPYLARLQTANDRQLAATQRDSGFEYFAQQNALRQEQLDLAIALRDLEAERLESGGFLDKATLIREENALLAHQAEMAQKVLDIRRRYADQPEFRDSLLFQLQRLNEVKLDNIKAEFKTLGEQILDVGKNAFESFFESIFSGTQSIGEAFSSMTRSILSSIAQLAAKRFVTQLLSGVFGFSDGGTVDNYAQGGTVGEALRREGPRAVLAALTPGEEVLPIKTGEAQRYRMLKSIFGDNPLKQLDTIKNYFQGGMVTSDRLLSSLNTDFPSHSTPMPLTVGGNERSTSEQHSVNVYYNVYAENADDFTASEYQTTQKMIKRMRQAL